MSDDELSKGVLLFGLGQPEQPDQTGYYTSDLRKVGRRVRREIDSLTERGG